jgi:flavin-dependent dehydrogenase
MREIKILGGGLSGLTAAINLAKGGYQVDVYERDRDVGMRFHGDLQGLENWSEKGDVVEELPGMGIKINFDCDPFDHVTLTNCTETRDVLSERSLYYLVKRGPFPGTLDYGLKEQALQSGVDIHFEKTLPPNEADIVATGPILGKVVGVVKGIVFKTDLEDTVVLAFNDELAYRGYSYLLITKGYGCACSVVINELNRIGGCFENTMRFFMEKFDLDIRSPRDIGGVGSFSLEKVFRKGATLYVGESAGLQDLFWGFGMRLAIKSGYLAAHSIINNEDYGKNAEKHFRNKSKASIVNRYLWEKLSGKDYSFWINNAEFLKRMIHSMHNYNIFQRMIYPIALSHVRERYPRLKLSGSSKKIPA